MSISASNKQIGGRVQADELTSQKKNDGFGYYASITGEGTALSPNGLTADWRIGSTVRTMRCAACALVVEHVEIAVSNRGGRGGAIRRSIREWNKVK